MMPEILAYVLCNGALIAFLITNYATELQHNVQLGGHTQNWTLASANRFAPFEFFVACLM